MGVFGYYYRLIRVPIGPHLYACVLEERKTLFPSREDIKKVFADPGRFFSTPGLLVGTVFFAFSLTPSLLPRTTVVQGMISGFSFSAGYGLGVLGYALWCYLELPAFRPSIQRKIKIGAAGVSMGLAVLFLWWANDYQNSIRATMEMEETAGLQQVGIGLLACIVFLMVLCLAKCFRRTFQYLSLRLEQYIPRRVSRLVGFVLSILLFWGIIDGVIISTLLQSADQSYRQYDALLEPNVDKPENDLMSGSDGSRIEWEGMGREGRRFVASAPGREELARITGGEVRRPIRIYTGLNNGESPEERAQRTLEELRRVGAFDRSILVIATPTGTGWIDDSGIRPLEYLHRGDTATVAMQYSYLPSPLALTSEGAYGEESARILFENIYNHWTALQEKNRPDLYLYGLSLGALNSDRSFDFYDIINDPFDGVLWVGTPFRSETLQALVERRREGSPAWKPRFQDDSVVRFANQHGGLEEGEEEWGSFRIAYLQYASDPVTFFDPDMAYHEPDWMTPPRGPDVSDELWWFPIVTMLQVAADMGAGHSPTGYGHDYHALDYLQSWYHLTEPEGWTEEDLEQLRETLSAP